MKVLLGSRKSKWGSRPDESSKKFHGTKHCLRHEVHDQQILNTVGRRRVTTTADPNIDQPVRLIVAIHVTFRDDQAPTKQSL